MKLTAIGLALGLVFAGSAQAQLGYDFDVQTGYEFGCPALLVGVCGGPDTGFFGLTNNGLTTFNGTLSLQANAGNGTNFSTSAALNLAPGATVFISDSSGESSNQGGYNGPFGSTQPGAILNLNGLIVLGALNEGINQSVQDSDVHSGVFRTNPFGVNLDNYVFQGGDPIGRDTGDSFETTQSPGHFRLFERAAVTPPGTVPEPASLALLGLGVAGLSWSRRRR